MVPFPGKFFDWEYEVVGFKTEHYGEFAECICTYADGKKEKVGISIELLEEQVFYKKVA